MNLPGAITLPGGEAVRGRGLRNPVPDGIPSYGLYLGSAKLRDRHDDDLKWPHDWLDWPDFRVPRDREEATRSLKALHERARAGEAVEIACNGGVGRTGTAIACLAILDGVPPSEAVAWARAHYHHRAVETPWQRRWVARFG